MVCSGLVVEIMQVVYPIADYLKCLQFLVLIAIYWRQHLLLITNTLPGPSASKVTTHGAIQICLLLLLLTKRARYFHCKSIRNHCWRNWYWNVATSAGEIFTGGDFVLWQVTSINDVFRKGDFMIGGAIL